MRGDDGFGSALAGRLRGRVPWAVFDAGPAPENEAGRLLALRPAAVLLMDAARWGDAPGSLGFFDSEDIPWGGVSTHAVSLRLFASFLASEADSPVALLGAEPVAVGFAAPMSAAVGASVDAAAGFLEALGARRACGCGGQRGGGDGHPASGSPGVHACPL